MGAQPVSDPPQLECCRATLFAPHSAQRPFRRNMSSQSSGPQRITHGAIATARMWAQRLVSAGARLSGWSLAVRCPAQIEASGSRSADRAARIRRAVYEPELFTHAALENASHTRAAEVAPATPSQFLSTFGAGFLGVQSGRLGGDANRERRGKSEKEHLDSHVGLPARFDRQPALAAPASSPAGRMIPAASYPSREICRMLPRALPRRIFAGGVLNGSDSEVLDLTLVSGVGIEPTTT